MTLFRSLKSRILAGMLGVVLLTTISILILTRMTVGRAVSVSMNDSAHNLVNTVVLNVENQYRSILFHKESTLERRKAELKNITSLAITVVEGYYNRYAGGFLTEEEAQRQAVGEIKRLRYDDGVGYLWINDTRRPFPMMIMHPTIPEQDGTVLDDPSFNTALGVGANLFAAMVDVCLETGEGFVDYLWPKPTREGLTAEQPKISYVQLFREWDWVIGTGVYIDDIEEEVQKRLDAVLVELRDTFSRVRIAESGYMYIFRGDKEILIHPALAGTNGSFLINPATGLPLLDDLMQASETPDIPFEYIWDKPQYEDQFRFRKLAYIHYFEPLDWYLASSVYLDEIEKPARQVGQQILLLSLIFFSAAALLSLFLARSLTGALRQLMLAAQDIERGGSLDVKIPVGGTMETRKLGIILGNMIESIRKTGEQLRQAQKMETVGTLAGGLAHDFNNMLGGIIGTLSMMEHRLDRDGCVEKEKLEEYMATMDDCSQRAANMVQQLLSLSRKQELSFTTVDLNLTVRHVMKICESSFDKSVRLIPVYRSGPALVKADPTQIEQALLNFCVNADHAMTLMRGEGERWGGELTVTVDSVDADPIFCRTHPEAKEGQFYCCAVQDTGVGMDMTTVSRIFNPFFTTKKKGEGSGLGLSMVYNIIKQHGGFINVYSEPGIGSTFRIYLPALGAEQVGDIALARRETVPEGEGLILVVDDEKAMRETAREILTTCGYRILIAVNGRDGVKQFRKHHREIEAVLLDMAMPEMSGKEAYLRMKEIDPDIRVILTSGFRQDERVEDVLDLGVKEFVQKPYTLEKLAKAMNRVIPGPEKDH